MLPSFLCIKLLIYGIYYNSKCNIWGKLEETWSWFEILSVCTTICDKIKMSIHKKNTKKKIYSFLLFTQRDRLTKCFVTYVNRNPQKKSNKTVWLEILLCIFFIWYFRKFFILDANFYLLCLIFEMTNFVLSETIEIFRIYSSKVIIGNKILNLYFVVLSY